MPLTDTPPAGVPDDPEIATPTPKPEATALILAAGGEGHLSANNVTRNPQSRSAATSRSSVKVHSTASRSLSSSRAPSREL